MSLPGREMREGARSFDKASDTLPTNETALLLARADEPGTATVEITVHVLDRANAHWTVPVWFDGSDDPFDLLLDTGATAIYVRSSDLPPDQTAGLATYPLDPAEPDCGYDQDVVSFVDGARYRAFRVSDDIDVGGLTLPDFRFQAVAEASPGLFVPSTDGGFGLQPNSPWLTSAFASDDLLEPVVSFDLDLEQPSAMHLGYIDADKTAGDMAWIDAYPDKSWTADTTEYGRCFLDTGSTAIFLPEASVVAYYEEHLNWGLEWARTALGTYWVACDAELRDLTVTFGGRSWTVPGERIIMDISGEDEDAEGETDDEMEGVQEAEGKTAWCLPHVQSTKVVPGLLAQRDCMLGSAFLTEFIFAIRQQQGTQWQFGLADRS